MQMINLGLHEYTWNSVELSDYIEKCHSLICSDVFQNLELLQLNHKEILNIVDNWCDLDSDVFAKHATTVTTEDDTHDESDGACLSARELQSNQEWVLSFSYIHLF